MASKRRLRTDITLWDRVRLRHELCARPARVLRWFKTCQIDSLMELAVFVEIRRETPEIALRIALVAASMGIRIGTEDCHGQEPRENGKLTNEQITIALLADETDPGGAEAQDSGAGGTDDAGGANAA